MNTKQDFDAMVGAYQDHLKTGISGKNLLVKASSIDGAGLGVFAQVDFAEQDIIEFCHCVVFDWRRKYIKEPRIEQYAYSPKCECEECKKHGANIVLPLGYGMIYNSAESLEAANCMFFIVPAHRMMAFVAKKPIKAGEEILTWWGQAYYDKWCKPVKEQTDAKQ